MLNDYLTPSCTFKDFSTKDHECNNLIKEIHANAQNCEDIINRKSTNHVISIIIRTALVALGLHIIIKLLQFCLKKSTQACIKKIISHPKNTKSTSCLSKINPFRSKSTQQNTMN